MPCCADSPGERCGLLVIEAAEFGHGDDELVGGQGSHAGDAGEDLVAPGKRGLGSDEGGDLCVEGLDMPVDLFGSTTTSLHSYAGAGAVHAITSDPESAMLTQGSMSIRRFGCI